MAVENPFSVFPREIRDKIYNYTLQDIKFTNILAHKTAYTPQNAPILYINDAIANDIKHLLYQDHEILVHIAQPRRYAEGPTGYLSHVQKCSRLMKQRSHTFVAELWRSRYSRLDPSYEGCNDSEEEFGRNVGPLTVPAISGDENGELLGRKFFGELVAVQPELPNLKKIDVNCWIVIYLIGFNKHWEEPLNQYLETRMADHTVIYAGEP